MIDDFFWVAIARHRLRVGVRTPLEERVLLQERRAEQQTAARGLLSLRRQPHARAGHHPLLQRYTRAHTHAG